MDNPYQSPTREIVLPALLPFRWRRVLAWAALIYAAAVTIGLASGLSMSFWEIYGSTFEEVDANARLVRRIAYGVVGAILYWRFAAPVEQRVLGVLAVFTAVRMIDVAASFLVFGNSVSELIEPWALGRSFLAALVGLGLASLRSHGSSRPPPLRQPE